MNIERRLEKMNALKDLIESSGLMFDWVCRNEQTRLGSGIHLVNNNDIYNEGDKDIVYDIKIDFNYEDETEEFYNILTEVYPDFSTNENKEVNTINDLSPQQVVEELKKLETYIKSL